MTGEGAQGVANSGGDKREAFAVADGNGLKEFLAEESSGFGWFDTVVVEGLFGFVEGSSFATEPTDGVDEVLGEFAGGGDGCGEELDAVSSITTGLLIVSNREKGVILGELVEDSGGEVVGVGGDGGRG